MRGVRPTWPYDARLSVYRVAELQALLYGIGAHVEKACRPGRDLCVAQRNMAAAESIHENIHRLSLAYGIGYLHKHTVGDAGGAEVFGDVTCRICRRAVNLAGVLARECAAAVGAVTSVGVYDYLAPGQAGITVRAADSRIYPSGSHKV